MKAVKIINKITTHGGTFHADEVSAIALVNVLQGATKVIVERTFRPSWDGNNAHIIIDIGGKFEKGVWLDHHHDPKLPASNILVLDECIARGLITDEEAGELFPFFDRVAKIDCGLIPQSEIQPTEFSVLIRGFNSAEEDNFEVALRFAELVIGNMVRSVRQKIRNKKLWMNLPRKEKNLIAVNESSNHLIGWKEFAKEDGTLLLISPNARGGWQVVVRDSDEFTIPVHESQSFRHNSGFMAVYPSKEDALNHARWMTTYHIPFEFNIEFEGGPQRTVCMSYSDVHDRAREIGGSFTVRRRYRNNGVGCAPYVMPGFYTLSEAKKECMNVLTIHSQLQPEVAEDWWVTPLINIP